jgi:hypothetical protein
VEESFVLLSVGVEEPPYCILLRNTSEMFLVYVIASKKLTFKLASAFGGSWSNMTGAYP